MCIYRERKRQSARGTCTHHQDRYPREILALPRATACGNAPNESRAHAESSRVMWAGLGQVVIRQVGQVGRHAVCCSVLQCTAVFCSVLLCPAVCCCVLQSSLSSFLPAPPSPTHAFPSTRTHERDPSHIPVCVCIISLCVSKSYPCVCLCVTKSYPCVSKSYG